MVHLFDENKKQIGTLNSDGRILPSGKLDVLVYNFFQDIKGNIWLATKRKGLIRLIPTGGKNSFRIEKFVHNPNDIYSPASNDFYSVTQDKTGRIWAATYGGGLHMLDEKNGKVRFYHAKNDLKSYPFLSFCIFVKSHKLLINYNKTSAFFVQVFFVPTDRCSLLPILFPSSVHPFPPTSSFTPKVLSGFPEDPDPPAAL